MKDVGAAPEPRVGRKIGSDRLLVAEEKEADVRPPFECERRRGQHDGRAVIAPHRVQRYADIRRHSSCPTAPSPARAAPGAADNSVFAA